MANIIKFRPKPIPNKLDDSVNRLIGKMDYLIEDEDHISLCAAIILDDGSGHKRVIELDNQKQTVNITKYTPADEASPANNP